MDRVHERCLLRHATQGSQDRMSREDGVEMDHVEVFRSENACHGC